MVVYQAQNVYGNWIEGGPRGTIYDCATQADGLIQLRLKMVF